MGQKWWIVFDLVWEEVESIYEYHPSINSQGRLCDKSMMDYG